MNTRLHCRNRRRPGLLVSPCRRAVPRTGRLAPRDRRQVPASAYAKGAAQSRPALRSPRRLGRWPMIGEPPEWMLWTMFGLMAFIMLIPLLKALAPPPCPAAARDGAYTLGGGKGSRADSGRILPRMIATALSNIFPVRFSGRPPNLKSSPHPGDRCADSGRLKGALSLVD
jgi:hypothetical protein